MAGGRVGVAVGKGSGVGVAGGGTGVSVGGTDVGVGDAGVSVGGTGVSVGGIGVGVGGIGVSVGGIGVGVGAAGVSVAGPGVTVGHGVGGHGCAPTGINENDATASKATVNEVAMLRKRIAKPPLLQDKRQVNVKSGALVIIHQEHTR